MVSLAQRIDGLEVVVQDEQNARERLERVVNKDCDETRTLADSLVALQEQVSMSQADLKDQQDAMVTILDMLDRSITVSDTHDLLEELADKLQKNFAEKFAQSKTDALVLHDKLEASARHILSKVDDVAATSSSASASLERQVVAVEEALARFSGALDTRVAEITSAQSAEKESFHAAISHAEADLARRLDALECSHESDIELIKQSARTDRLQLESSSEALEKHLRDQFLSSLEAMSAQINTAVTTMSTDLESNKRNLLIHCSGVEENLNGKIDNECGALYDRLSCAINSMAEEQIKTLQHSHARMEIENKAAQKEIKLAQELSKQDTSAMAQNLLELQKNVQFNAASMQREFNMRFARMDEQVVALGQLTDCGFVEVHTRIDRVSEEVQHFVVHVGVDKEATQAAFHTVEGKVADFAARLTQDLAKHCTDFTAMCASIEKKMVDTKSAQSAIITDHFDHFEHARGEASSALLGQAELIQAHWQHFTGKCDTMEKVLHLNSTALQNNLSHFSILCADLEGRFQGQHEALREQLDGHIDGKCLAQKNAIERLQQSMSAMQTGLESNTAAHVEAVAVARRDLEDRIKEISVAQQSRWSSKMSAIEDVVSQQAAKCKSATTHLVDRISGTEENIETIMAQSAQAESHNKSRHDRLVGECKQMEHSLRAAMSSSSNHISSARLALEKKCDNLFATIDNRCLPLSKASSRQATRMDQLEQKFTAACDSLYAHISDKTTALSSRIEIQHRTCEALDVTIAEHTAAVHERLQDDRLSILEARSDFAEISGILDEKFSNEIAAHESLISAHFAHFTQVVEASSGRLSEQITAQDDQLNRLSSQYEQTRSHFAEVCASLDEKLTAADAGQGARARQHHAHFTDTYKDLDTKLDHLSTAMMDQYTGTKSALDDYHVKMVGANAELDEKITKATTTISDTLSRFAEKNSSQDTRADCLGNLIEQHHAQFTALCADFDRKRASDQQDHKIYAAVDRANLTAKFTDVHAQLKAMALSYESQMDKVHNMVVENHDKLTCDFGQMECKFAAETAAHEESLHLHHQHFTKCNATLNQKTTEKHILQDACIKELQAAIQAVRTHVSHSCGQIEDKFYAENSAQDLRSKKQHDHFSLICNRLEKQLTERHQEQINRIDDWQVAAMCHFDRLTVACSSIDSKFSLKTEAQESHLEELGEAIKSAKAQLLQKFEDTGENYDRLLSELDFALQEEREHTSQCYTTLEKSVAERVSLVESNAHKSFLELNDWCTNLDSASQEKASLLKADIESVKVSLHDNIENVSNVCSNLESKVDLKFRCQDDRMETQEQQFAGKYANVHHKFVQKNSAQDARIDEVSSEMHHNIRQLTALVDDSLSRFNESIHYHSDRADTHHAHFTQLCCTLEREASDRNASQNARLDDLISQQLSANAQHSAAIQQMDSKFSSAVAYLQEKLSNLNQHCVDVSSGVQMQVVEFNAAHAKRTDSLDEQLRSNHTSLVAKCEALELGLAQTGASQCRVSENLTAKLNTQRDDLEQKLFEHMRTTSSRADHLSRTMDEQHTHAIQECESIDAKYMVKSTAQSDQIEIQGLHLTKLIESLDSRCMDLLAAYREDCRSIERDLSTKCSELDSHHSNRIDELSSIMLHHHRHFTAVCGLIDETCISGIEAHKKRTEAQASKITKLIEDVGDKLVDQGSAHGQQITNIADEFHNNRRYFTDIVDQLDASLGRKHQELCSIVESRHSQVCEVCDAMDGKFTLQLTALDARQDRITSSIENLNDNVSSSVKHLDQKLTGVITLQDDNAVQKDAQHATELRDIDRQLKSSAVAQSENVEALKVHVDHMYTQLDDMHTKYAADEAAKAAEAQTEFAQWRLETGDILEQMNLKFSEVARIQDEGLHSLKETVHEQCEHQMRVCAQLDEKFTNRAAGQDACHQDFSSEIRKSLEAARSDLSHELAEHQRQRYDTEKMLERLQHELTARTNDNWSICTEMCTLLEQKQSDEIGIQSSLLEQLKTQLSTACASIDRKFSDENMAQEKQLETFHAQLHTVQNTLEARITGESDSLRALFSDSCSRVENKVITTAEEFERRLRTEHSHLQTMCNEITQRSEQLFGDMDEKVVEMVSAVHDKHCVAHETQKELIENNHRFTIESCRSAEAALDTRNAIVDARLASMQSELASQLSVLSISLVEESAVLENRCEKHRLHCSREVERLALMLGEGHQHLSNRLNHLNIQFSDASTSLTQNQEEQRKHFTTLCERLHTNVADSASLLEDKFDKMCSRLDRKYSAISHNQASQMAEQSLQFKTLDDRLDAIATTKCEKSIARLDATCEDQQARLNVLAAVMPKQRQEFRDSVATLEAKWGSLIVEIDAHIADNQERAHVAMTLLDEKFTTQIVAAENNNSKILTTRNEDLDRIFAKIHQDIQNVSGMCVEVEAKRISDGATASTDRARQEQQLTESMSIFQTYLDSQIMDLKLTMRDSSESLVTRAEAFENSIGDSLVALQSKLNREWHESVVSLSQRLNIIDNQIDEERQCRTDVIVSNEKQLSEKINQVDKILSKQITAAVARCSQAAAECNTDVAEGRVYFSDWCRALDEKLDAVNTSSKEATSSLQPMMSDLEARFRKDVDRVHDEYLAANAELVRHIDEKDSSQDKTIAANFQNLSQNHANLCSHVDEKLSIEAKDTYEQLRELRRLCDDNASKASKAAGEVGMQSETALNVLDKDLREAVALVQNARAQDNENVIKTFSALEGKFVTMISDVDERCASTLSVQRLQQQSLSAQLQKSTAYLTDAVDQLVLKFSNELEAQDQRSKSVCEELTSKFTSSESKIKQECRVLQDQMTEKNLAQDERFDHLSMTIENQSGYSAEMSQAVESRCLRELAAISALFESSEKQMKESGNDLRNQFHDEVVQLRQTIDDQGKEVTTRTDTIREQSEAEQVAFAATFTALCTELNTKLQTTTASITGRQEELFAHAEAQSQAQHDAHVAYVHAAASQLQNAMDAQSKVLAAHQHAIAAHNHLPEALSDAVSTIEAIKVSCEMGIEDAVSRMAASMSEFDARISSVLNDLDLQHCAKSATLTEHLQHLNSTVQEHQAHMQVALQDERSYSANNKAAQDSIIEENYIYLVSVTSKLDCTLNGAISDVEDHLHAEVKSLREDLQGTRMQFTEANTAMSDRLTAAQQRLEKRAEERNLAIDRRIASESEQFSTRMSQVDQQRVAELVEMRSTVDDTCNTLAAKIAEQTTREHSNFEHHQAVCSKMKQLFTEQSGLLIERIDSQHSRLTHEMQQCDEKLSEFVDQLEDKLKASSSKSEQRIAKVEHVVASHHSHFSGLCDSVNRDMHNVSVELRDLIDIHVNHLASYDESIEQKLNNLYLTQNEVIEAQHHHFGGVCGALENKMCEDLSSLDSKVAGIFINLEKSVLEAVVSHDARADTKMEQLSNQIAETARSTSQQHEAIDAKFDAKILALNNRCSELDESRHDHSKFVASLCAGIEAKLSERLTSHELAVASDKEHFANISQHLDQKLEQAALQLGGAITSADTARQASIDNLSSALQLAQTQNFARYEALESGLSSAAEDNENKLISLNHRVTRSCLDTASDVANVTQTLEARVRGLEASLLEVTQQSMANYDAKTAEVAQRLTDVCNAINEKLDHQHTELHAKHATHASKMQGVIDAIEQKLHHTSATLSSSQQHEMSQLHAKINEIGSTLAERVDIEHEETEVKLTSLEALIATERLQVPRSITAAIEGLDRSVAERLAIIQGSNESFQASISNRDAVQEKARVALTQDLDTRFAEALASVDQKHVDSLHVFAMKHEQFARHCSEKHDQLEVALANKSKTMSEISVNQADLSQQFDLKSAEHQNAIHELQTACAKLGSELEHCLGDQATIENVDRRYSDICTLLRTEQQKLVKSLEFVQQQSHTAVEAGERRCDSVAKDLTDRIDAMDAKFGEICRRSIDSAEAAMIEIARLKV